MLPSNTRTFLQPGIWQVCSKERDKEKKFNATDVVRILLENNNINYQLIIDVVIFDECEFLIFDGCYF